MLRPAAPVLAAVWAISGCTGSPPEPSDAIVDACRRFDEAMIVVRNGEFDYPELQALVDGVRDAAMTTGDGILRNAADEMVERLEAGQASDFIDRAQLFGGQCERLGADG